MWLVCAHKDVIPSSIIMLYVIQIGRTHFSVTHTIQPNRYKNFYTSDVPLLNSDLVSEGILSVVNNDPSHSPACDHVPRERS